MQQKTLALSGAGIAAIGLFLPLYANQMDSGNVFSLPNHEGWAIVVAVALAAFFAYMQKLRELLWVGIAILVTTAWALYRVYSLISGQGSAAVYGESNAVTDALDRIQQYGFSFGWVALIAGALILIYVGAVVHDESDATSNDEEV